jgi:hypothetical protein
MAADAQKFAARVLIDEEGGKTDNLATSVRECLTLLSP